MNWTRCSHWVKYVTSPSRVRPAACFLHAELIPPGARYRDFTQRLHNVWLRRSHLYPCDFLANTLFVGGSLSLPVTVVVVSPQSSHQLVRPLLAPRFGFMTHFLSGGSQRFQQQPLSDRPAVLYLLTRAGRHSGYRARCFPRELLEETKNRAETERILIKRGLGFTPQSCRGSA